MALLFATALRAVEQPANAPAAAVTLPGGLIVRFPLLTNVAAQQTLDVRLAEQRTVVGPLEIRSVSPRGNRALVIHELANKGTNHLAVQIETPIKQSLNVEPGKTARIIFNVATTNLLASLPEADKLLAEHRQWWDAYWSRTEVRLDAEPVLERIWAASMYVLGCNSPPAQPSTNSLETAISEINHWFRTRDIERLKQHYPALRALAEHWDQHLEKHKECWSEGAYRYVVADGSFNSIITLAALRRFYQGMIDATCELNVAGFPTERSGVHLARWEDFLARLSDYPMSHAFGRRVFAWDEETLNPFLRPDVAVLSAVFPADQISLGSEPRLLATARNTLIVKPQYYVQSSESLIVAARLAHHPPEVLERFRHRFRTVFLPDHATAQAVVEAVHGLLLHSHEGFLRLFPCWHHPNAGFISLPADGGFLVSAEKRNGVCQPIKVLSTRGRPCGVLNPWPGRTLTVNGVELAVENRAFGQLCLFPTEPGKTYVIATKEALPQSLPYWNAALYRPVTVSSQHQPAHEKENWAAEKLTDGTRINTRAGHRGWASALRDTPEANEWIQLDLGEALPIHAVNLWPLDHGDAWQSPDGSEPFVRSDELDQSYDGFPGDFCILVSADGQKWDEVARRQNFRAPVGALPTSDLKPADVTGPERFQFNPRTARHVKLQISKLRKTRTFGRYAACLAEIEVIRADTIP
ncbi:MAG: discoidin domain-containing protein [Verrucomicrobiae bacterium]|nr:discoidin domain-containing protein [Verrucomicrobiae bacterium]